MTKSQTLNSPERHRSHRGRGRSALGHAQVATGNAPPDDVLAQAISEAAYYCAEARGFEPGHEIEDWVAAEQQLMGPSKAADAAGD